VVQGSGGEYLVGTGSGLADRPAGFVQPCHPKELYEGKQIEADPDRRVLPPFNELIEAGKVIDLGFPVALNPAVAKTIGTMMKIDHQHAVQLGILRMEAEPDWPYRSTVFICDEHQTFATFRGDNPVGDERFFSISRQPKCFPIVASPSISSAKGVLPNDGSEVNARRPLCIPQMFEAPGWLKRVC
jgi:hypothetical protein